MPLLHIEDLHTYYGHVHALKGITLDVEAGEIVTLLGANGAGKSTTLRAISGLMVVVLKERCSMTGSWIIRRRWGSRYSKWRMLKSA